MIVIVGFGVTPGRSSLLKLEAGRLPVAPLGRSRAAARNGLGGAAVQRRGSGVTEAAAQARATERGDGQAGAGCMYGVLGLVLIQWVDWPGNHSWHSIEICVCIQWTESA